MAEAWRAVNDAGLKRSKTKTATDLLHEEYDVIPPMMQSLDLTLPMEETVNDLQVVQREFPDGQGKFEVLHNSGLSMSLMSGSFESAVSSGIKISGGTTRYEGTFLNDLHGECPKAHGQGVRINADESTYTGQWKDGFPHGHGEWKAAPPSIENYVGEWKRGKKHGFGVHRLPNGDVYEGDFEDGKFQDRGKYTYVNGDEFIGIWDKGIKKNGSYHYKDGRISRRTWENGKMVTCQEYDSRQRTYQPTITSAQMHDPERISYGVKNPDFGMVTTRGIRVS